MALAQPSVATGVIAIDTTGLPPGGTFGASTGLNTFGVGVGSTAGEPGTAELGDAAAARSGPLKVGQAFGPRYHVIKLLGVGGMGAVYQAWDAELNVAVALKVIRIDRRRGSASAEAEKRFKNELLLARQVTHKNVVRIHDLGEIEGIKYITMPYVQGDDLGMVLRRDGKLPIARGLRLARQLCGGLQAAHEAGVVHRDLKPSNIMIGSAGDDEQALIMDFGISASTAEETAGAVVGTLEYMSPEQGAGQGIDARSDLYAFGLILFELLVGLRSEQPKTGHERVAAMKQRFERGVPPLRTIDESMPEPLAALVARCVERDPANRFQLAADLGAALARLDDAGALIPEPRKVSTRVLSAAAALVAVLLAGTYFAARRAAPVAPRDPVSVLVADFDNRTGDPVFQGSLEQTLGVAVEGASFVTSYPRRDAQRLTTQLKPGSTLDESAARLISLREGIKVILAGTIERAGSGYKVTVRALEPAANKTLVTATASAGSKDDVLRAVGTIAARVRRVLGDTAPERASLAYTENLTATSLVAVREYSAGQDLLQSGKFEDAIAAYQRAVEQDPKFGRAYSGWATAAFYLGRQEEAADQWKKALAVMDRMTDREKYLTLGTYYLAVARNYDKAVENYSALVKLYPADRVGHNNLAFAYFALRNFQKALEEGRRTLEIYPKNTIVRNNYALYAMYASDFNLADAESKKLIEQDQTFFKAYLPLAIAGLARGDSAGAAAAYERMAKVGTQGASLAAIGLADLALYEGRFADAEQRLVAGIAADRKSGDGAGVAAKLVALADAYDGLGRKDAVVATLRQALTQQPDETTMVPAGLLFVQNDRAAEAKPLVTALAQQLQTLNRAYGKTLEGELAQREHRTIDALEAFQAAQKLADLWLTRFALGVTYVEAGHEPEGLAELELCQKRRGEAAALFLDDVPTFRYLATLPYWLGRAQQGVGQTPAALANFKQFLIVRGRLASDPLVADATKRIASQ